MRHFLDFEKPIAALEGKVEELRHMSSDGSINIADEIGKLQSRIERELKQTYEKLGPWDTPSKRRLGSGTWPWRTSHSR